MTATFRWNIHFWPDSFRHSQLSGSITKPLHHIQDLKMIRCLWFQQPRTHSPSSTSVHEALLTPSSGTASHTRKKECERETETRALRQLAIMKVWAQICWATEKPAKGIPVNWLHNKKLCCRLMLICNASSNAACLFVRACVLRRGNVYYWCNEVKREGSAVRWYHLIIVLLSLVHLVDLKAGW